VDVGNLALKVRRKKRKLKNLLQQMSAKMLTFMKGHILESLTFRLKVYILVEFLNLVTLLIYSPLYY